MNELTKVEKVFEGQAITAYLWEEKPVWVAKELGRAMGYGEEGKGLLRSIQDWKEEMIAGVDFEVLEGERLTKFRDGLGRTSPQATPDVSPFAPSLLILKESGFHAVCLKTDKPVGVRLRRWLASEVMPSIMRTGSYQGAPQAQTFDTKEAVSGVMLALEEKAKRPSNAGTAAAALLLRYHKEVMKLQPKEMMASSPELVAKDITQDTRLGNPNFARTTPRGKEGHDVYKDSA